ncbi:prepilin-type N-terminal cleavage/methylation domain-containing protein [Campylobacter fetus]|nr:prepilin-type N-terminal cleavage/methylation domain-containing protein [Campylobacter fetus]EJU9539917.1 prepilin-type N-terminal cleavage/methylation domain-containing protein [Campylobacter fetus]
MRKAFTMIEIVFVIIILGILASIAIPIFNINREDSQIAKAQVELATIRSVIALKRNDSFLISDKSVIDLNDVLKEAEVSTQYNTSSDYLLRWSVNEANLKLDIKNNVTVTFNIDKNGNLYCDPNANDLCKKIEKKL